MALYRCGIDGGSKLIDLGTGTSFNVSSISGYQNFTLDNFIYHITTNPLHNFVQGYKESSGAGTQGVQGEYKLTFSYDNSTGIFTNSYWGRCEMSTNSGKVSIHAYLLLEPNKVKPF